MLSRFTNVEKKIKRIEMRNIPLMLDGIFAKFPTDSRRQLSEGATQLSDKQHGTQQLKEDRRKKQPSSYFQSVVEQTFAVAVGYFF